MSIDTEPAAIDDDVKTLAEMRRRHQIAVGQYDTLGNTGLLRAIALTEFPDLLDIAERGLAARHELEATAGLSIRAHAVRELHAPEDTGGGLLLCRTCSTWLFVIWPCPTLQLLDGLAAP